MTVRIAANYTAWNTHEVQAWIDQVLSQSEQAFQRLPPSSSPLYPYRRRPVHLLLFDWSPSRSPAGVDWAKQSAELDVHSKSATELTFELRLAAPDVLSNTPMQILVQQMSAPFELLQSHYLSLLDRLYFMLNREYPMVSAHSIVHQMVEDGVKITAGTPLTPAQKAESKTARLAFRRTMLTRKAEQEAHDIGFRHYERYLRQMSNKYESLRAAHRKTGFPVEVLEPIKAQLRQDLEWLESIQADAKKIQRPATTFKR